MARSTKLISFIKKYVSKLHSISSNNFLFHRKFQNQTFDSVHALERNVVRSHKKTWRNFNTYEVREASTKKGCLLYDSNSLTFWKRQNDGDGEKIRG